MKNIFLTGDVQIGKTTALKRIMEKLDLNYGGYLGHSLYSKKDNTKLIKAKSLYSKEIYTLARIDIYKGSINVYEDAFEEKLALDIEKSLDNKEAIVLDEIGRFEENYDLFKSAVYKALDSPFLILGVLKKYDGEFINSIKNREDTVVFEVNSKNRDRIPAKVLKYIKDNKLIN